jgi:predicted metal-dependent RNase
MVDFDGKNFYPTNAVWMTDGYGDYVKHYLRAMASAPELAPDNADHLLRSSSIIQQINYNENRITYKTFDDNSAELLRLTSKPNEVFVDGKSLNESQSENTGWQWEMMTKGGILRIFKQGSEVAIEK